MGSIKQGGECEKRTIPEKPKTTRGGATTTKGNRKQPHDTKKELRKKE